MRESEEKKKSGSDIAPINQSPIPHVCLVTHFPGFSPISLSLSKQKTPILILDLVVSSCIYIGTS